MPSGRCSGAAGRTLKVGASVAGLPTRCRAASKRWSAVPNYRAETLHVRGRTIYGRQLRGAPCTHSAIHFHRLISIATIFFHPQRVPAQVRGTPPGAIFGRVKMARGEWCAEAWRDHLPRCSKRR